jgi:hypothetical protein
MAALALMGVGMGCSIPSFLIAVQSSVARSQLGTATATLQFSRTIGGTLGVAVLGMLLSSQLTAALLAAGLSPNAVPIDALIGEGGAGASIAEGARGALALAIGHTFWLTLAIAVLALIVTLLAPRGDVAELKAKRDAREAVAAD